MRSCVPRTAADERLNTLSRREHSFVSPFRELPSFRSTVERRRAKDGLILESKGGAFFRPRTEKPSVSRTTGCHVLLQTVQISPQIDSAAAQLPYESTFVGSLDTLGSQRWDGLPSKPQAMKRPAGISITDEFEEGIRAHASRPIFFGAPDSSSTGRHRKTVALG